MKWALINFFRSSKTSLKHLILDHEASLLLKSNLKYKDSHIHERCFILGNGPSLKTYDLTCLKNEYVFAVNDFVRFPIVKEVVPNAYVLADSTFLNLNESNEQDMLFSNKIVNLSTINPEIELFVPLSSRDNIKRLQWNAKLNVNYFNSYTYLYHGFNKDIDLTKMIPGMQNVVQYCILIALYMGFSEIYLLGTEQTNIFGNLRSFISDDISEYAFSLSDKEKEWKHSKLTKPSLVETLRGYARIFELFDELSLYCANKNVKLYNCSPESLIQGIKKKDFLSLF